MKLEEHINALNQARYEALDKIVRGSRLKEAGERELASIDSMLALATDVSKTPEAESKTE